MLIFCRQYLVVINQNGNDVSHHTKKQSLPEECNINKLYNATVAAENNQACYITATFKPEQINTSGLVLTIGSEERNGGYYNQPLQKNQIYTAHIGYRGIIGVSEMSF